MDVVDAFVSQYERQFDFWEALAQTARGLLEVELTGSGIRGIVTSRAKTVDRLAEKLRRRDRVQPYRSVAEIGEQVTDLAGVRVALYFPGQMDEVELVINSLFDVQKTKRLPVDEQPTLGISSDESRPETDASQVSRSDAHQQRFSGYGARHFRVHIPISRLGVAQDRYAAALVEVQVASVLMHAWSEVEHDLVYKPLEGKLSPSEYALLDQLNGLVLAGEIALEQLQKAGDLRVASAETAFRDHYELAEFLRSRLAALGVDLTDATLGPVDVLFVYLVEQGFATASAVGPYLSELERDFERRPVADQLADLMLSLDESRYSAYLRAMSASRDPSKHRRTGMEDAIANSPDALALGEFVAAWVLFETQLRRSLAEDEEERRPSLPALFRRLSDRKLISRSEFAELDLMRQLRNQVLHERVQSVPPERLTASAAWLRDLTAGIHRKTNER